MKYERLLDEARGWRHGPFLVRRLADALEESEREVERLREGISGVADLIDTDVTSGHAFPHSYAVALSALAASREDQP